MTNIFVRLTSGKMLPIEVAVDSTVDDIKKELSHITPCPVLLYRGEKISNSNLSLADLGLCSDEVLDLQEEPMVFMFYQQMVAGIDVTIIDRLLRIVYSIQNKIGGLRFSIHELAEDEAFHYIYDYANVIIKFDGERVIEEVYDDGELCMSEELTMANEMTFKLLPLTAEKDREVLTNIFMNYPQFKINCVEND